ncbi:MAG: fibrobacter succinogenes major paralogous domain-containing protein [Rhodothermales bacterium]
MVAYYPFRSLGGSCILIASLVIVGWLSGCAPNNQPPLLDIDGDTYRTAAIGNQLWMLDNLRSTVDQAGGPISYTYPNDDSVNGTAFGLLYDHPTALTVCPSGWHLPSNADWLALIAAFDQNDAAYFKDPGYWGSTTSVNLNVFDARPAGYGHAAPNDNLFGKRAIFWSSATDGDDFAWGFMLAHDADSLRYASQHAHYGFSVRCVQSN